MSSIERPSRLYSFANHSLHHPKEQLPGDRLDAQIQNLITAIDSTQRALADIRRDDGLLKNASIGTEQLKPDIAEHIADGIVKRTQGLAHRAEQGAAVVHAAERTASLFAKDAEAAAISASQFLSAVNLSRQIVERNADHVSTLSNEIDAWTSDAENWADYAQANASNAIAAKDEALQWAEYLAGPVVDGAAAPAYIAGSAFPHGLYYQPVEGYGGVAGLWSAKWWAIYAAQLVGSWGFYYLGAWATPPVPGSTNPATGIQVPNPLALGSFYYDTVKQQLYVWNGSSWAAPYQLSTGVSSTYVYHATAGQTVFSGADFYGNTPTVGTSPSDVHKAGLRLVNPADYSVNATTSTLTLVVPATAGQVIQWDLLVAPSQLAPGAVNIFKVQLTPSAPDGTTTAFTMKYVDPSSGLSVVTATDAAQLDVSIDGIIQEPGVDYVTGSGTLTFGKAPVADAHLWVVWAVANGSTSGGGGSTGNVSGPVSSVDNNIAIFNGTTGQFIKDGGKRVSDLLLLAGGTLTGPLILAADPAVTLGAATKGYVDTHTVAPGNASPIMDGIVAVGTSLLYSRQDHVHPTDTSRAATTYVDSQDATKAATTYVDSQDALKANITYVDSQDGLKAPLASPAFTGTPTAPTQAATDSSTKLATTAFVAASSFASGTVLLFYQSAAPTGWTKLTTQNDKALRVVSGSGGVAGGTNAFSTVMAQTVVGSHTDTLAETVSHTHGGYVCTVLGGFGPTFTIYLGADSSQGLAGFGPNPAVGSSGAHNHTIAMGIQYIDVILASKN